MVAPPDGLSWTSHTSPVQDQLRAITYGDAHFVAVGGTGTTVLIVASPDGVNWVLRQASDMADGRSLSGIAYGNRQFVAVGGWYNSTTGLNEPLTETSADAVNWVEHQPRAT